MSPLLRLLPALIVGLAPLLAPASAIADSALATGGAPLSASASLNFRIVIPPMMKIMENSHPPQLDAGTDGELSAEQRLVVLSNMKRGFCVTLRLARSDLGNWRMDTAEDNGVSLNPVADGYRLCSARPGRYTLVLRHRFDGFDPGQQAQRDWPVHTDITAI